MKGTELAKAYVQIIPSADGIKGKLGNILGSEASTAGDSAGKTAGTSLASAIKNTIVAAGIGTAISNALTQGANLQQSLGGIETLFKDSADKVIANAKEAYRTAGLSANEYMESVTGFSASLLQGMAGDTSKAADVAHMALTDMSDNANKMGTSMELIQNAYQGFAKQNYIMLDNLKLGYGGTKEEMQRLLTDAQALSGVKYDLSNLGDVYSAIHVIQEEIGITGTTTKEASATFSGSLAAMKAAFDNLLGNFVLGEKLTDSFNALSDTTKTFVLNNLIPMLGNILSEIPTIIYQGLFFALDISQYVKDNMATMIQSGIELVGGIAAGIVYSTAYIAEATYFIIKEVGDVLINTDWASVATEFIRKLANKLYLASNEILGEDGSIISSILEGIIKYLPTFQEKVTGIFASLWETCKKVWMEIGQPIADMIISAFQFVSDNWEIISSTISTLFEALWDICKSLWDTVGQPVWDTISFVIKEVSDLFAEYMPKIMGFFQDAVSGIKDTWENHLKPVFEIIGDFLQTVLKPTFEYVFDTIIKPLVDNVFGFIVELWNDTLKPAFDAICDFLTGAFTGDWEQAFEGISNIVQAVLDGIETAFDFCFAFLKEVALKIWDDIQIVWNEVAGWFNKNVIQPLVEFFTELQNDMQEIWDSICEAVSDAVGQMVEFFTNLWNDMQEIWDSICDVVSVALGLIGSIISAAFQIITLPFQFIWQNCKDSVLEAWEWISGKISEVLDFVGGIISDVLDDISSTMTSVWNNVKDTVSEAWNNIKEKVGTKLNEIKESVTSSFNKIKESISNAIENVKTKIKSGFDKIKENVSSILDKIKTTVENAWNNIKTTISNKVEDVKSKVNSVFDSIKSGVSDKFNGIKSTADTVWGNIKNSIIGPMEKARDAIKGVVDKIKGFFNFQVSLPKIKLPHFSIKPKGWELGDLLEGSIPSLGIEWYAKAMRKPMIMDSPTAFGINSLGQIRAGGEAGSEVVSGTDILMKMISEAVATQNEAVVHYLEKLIHILAEYFPQILVAMEKDIYLDSGELIGRLIPEIDREMGRYTLLAERGVR